MDDTKVNLDDSIIDTTSIQEMPIAKSINEMTKRELLEICVAKGIEANNKMANAKIIELIELSTAPIINLDNSPISNAIMSEKEEIPTNFVNIPREIKKPKEEIKSNKGRLYKELAHGVGMYMDNGTTFLISSIE